MHRSWKVKLCLLGLAVCSAALIAAGCGGTHEHAYAAQWAFDATSHWHPATCGHDTKSAKSGHVFSETVVAPQDGASGYTLHICACGYAYTSDPVDPSPEPSALYRFDETSHWTAGDPDEKTGHAYTEETVEATCTAAGYTKHSCVCGYWYASDPVAPKAHTPSEAVEYDADVHWHPCLVCGAKVGAEAHGYSETVIPATCEEGGRSVFTCTTCGRTYEGNLTPASHRYSDTLESDEYQHWYPAICEHEGEKGYVEDHAIFGASTECAICGKTIQPRLCFAWSADKTYFIVTGMGSLTGDTVEIPATYRDLPVRAIAAHAFENTGLKSVTFAENLQEIGLAAFSGTELSSISFPESLTSIGTKAFAGTPLSELRLGASVKSIGQAAFLGCENLQTVEIASSSVTLSTAVFEGCTQLQRVQASAKEIGARAFAGCANLTEFALTGCERVGFSAFGGCTSYAPELPATLVFAEEYAFSGCGIVSLNLPALKEVAPNMFENCTALTAATLGAETIGSAAFKGCTLLSSLTLTKAVEIGSEAFQGCSALSAVAFPESILRVGAGAFAGTDAYTAADGAQYCGNVLVGATEGTTQIAVRAGTIGIADEALRGAKLQQITLAQGMRFVGVGALRECSALSAVEFPASLKLIGSNAFRESGLVNVTVPATVESVGDNAFYDCMSLTTVSVSAKTIGRFAFSYTGEGRTLESPIPQRPKDAKLTSVTLGEGVETLGSNAFQYCPIAQVTLPGSLRSIGKYTFAQTDLQAISIPAQVARIGEYAFYATRLNSATFAEKTGWTAGSAQLTLSSASRAATYLKETYVDIDWVRG